MKPNLNNIIDPYGTGYRTDHRGTIRRTTPKLTGKRREAFRREQKAAAALEGGAQ